MTAYTPRGYPYPDDYQAAADVPAALDALATAVSADVDLVDGRVGANANEITALKARQVIAGNGLTGGGSLAANRTLAVGAGTGISVGADTVGLNLTYTDGRYQAKDGNTAKIAPEGTVNVGDKSMGVLVWTVGNLAAGEEKETTVQVAKGSYVFVSVQHPAEDADSLDKVETRWPDFANAMPPRPAVVAIQREDGGDVGE